MGYNEKFTIGVWVGNLYNNEPLFDLPAVTGAGMMLRNILLELWNMGYPFPPFSKDGLAITNIKICTLSGDVAKKECESIL